jgi:hypothetical protein
MTIDVDGIRVSGRLWGDNYALLTGYQIIALCDALDAEREKVRVLHNAGGYLYTVVQLHWARSGTSDDDAEAAMRAWQRAIDALAATDDGGGA